jgi:alpha-L-arabinofuranosidase
VGLIGTHWSKGWIIEDNDIRYSVCSGISLGKYGDCHDNTSADSAEGYVDTINRALERGWSKENIGGHLIQNNHISHCEQTGIVGSMGAVFSTVSNNTICDIHVRALFGGAEMAAIKFHGAIDTVICGNHIYRATRGIWLDWMTQGTRVTRNLLHDNRPDEDLFVEVNQGPFLIDNNIMLSPQGVLVNSHGGAYAHNLIGGRVHVMHHEKRLTPYHKGHTTEVAGLNGNPSGDDRYYNNILTGGGLAAYDEATLPVYMSGNIFLNGSKASKHEPRPTEDDEPDPDLKLLEKPDGVVLEITVDRAWATERRKVVTSELLGNATTPALGYEQADGTPYRIVRDYLGNERNPGNPCPGPFELSAGGRHSLKVWPISLSKA